jgi:MHS family proline/betaine transporter-like MFS transporter
MFAVGPADTRAVGIAFSYGISVTIFGGFAPFVATWLIAVTGEPLSPSFYLMATSLLSVGTLMAFQYRAARVPSRGQLDGSAG